MDDPLEHSFADSTEELKKNPIFKPCSDKWILMSLAVESWLKAKVFMNEAAFTLAYDGHTALSLPKLAHVLGGALVQNVKAL